MNTLFVLFLAISMVFLIVAMIFAIFLMAYIVVQILKDTKV